MPGEMNIFDKILACILIVLTTGFMAVIGTIVYVVLTHLE